MVFLMLSMPLRSMQVETKSAWLSLIACTAPEMSFAEKPNERLVSNTTGSAPHFSYASLVRLAHSDDCGDEPYAKMAGRLKPSWFAMKGAAHCGHSFRHRYEPYVPNMFGE